MAFYTAVRDVKSSSKSKGIGTDVLTKNSEVIFKTLVKEKRNLSVFVTRICHIKSILLQPDASA